MSETIIKREEKKIRRKRGGCSPSSSAASSALQNYRFKRAILGNKNKSIIGSTTTPVPTWRMLASRSPSLILRAAASTASPGQDQPPVSARKLAATLWELHEVRSPRVVEDHHHDHHDDDDDDEKEEFVEERVGRRRAKVRNCLPPHLSDPSHSPVSERMERSGTGTHRRRESSTSRRLKTDYFDTVSNASFMEIETRPRCQTSSGSAVGGKSRLKDVSNAVTTSKELLKIICRMWSQEDHHSSSMSLISALHSELERARLQINQLIHSDDKEIRKLLKRFAEEKAAWKIKEQEAIESAVEAIAGELEVERKLRRRFESLNKKLGKELAETKASFLKAVKELDELAGNIGEDKAEVEEMKRETMRMQEEMEREREMLHIAEALREERTQMKISDAKHHFDEKNANVEKIRNDLEAYLRSNSTKENGHNSVYHRRDVDLAFCRNEARESDKGEVEEDTVDGENSGESDLHSIELNLSNPSKNYKPEPRNSKRAVVDEETKGRKSIFNQVARRSTSLFRSVSNIVEWGNGSNHELDKQVARKSCGDEIQRYKSGKGARDHTLPSSRFGLEREVGSPANQRGPPWPSREPCSSALQRHVTPEGGEVRGRRSRR